MERAARATPGEHPSSGGQGPEFAGLVTPGWNWATLGEQKMNERRPMTNTTMTNSLVQTWVPVTDADGRTHLEARWTPAHAGAPVQAPHAA
ncbi:hypothetical protein Noca_4604 [Nocardioides sp. JS614]|nr:hypothetical protein Noca_4604 [Nocardioides sp. JS614]